MTGRKTNLFSDVFQIVLEESLFFASFPKGAVKANLIFFRPFSKSGWKKILIFLSDVFGRRMLDFFAVCYVHVCSLVDFTDNFTKRIPCHIYV